MGLGVTCLTIVNEYLPNRRKWLDFEELLVFGDPGESVGHSGVDEDGHRGLRAYRV
jgi:hypothetical protein